MSDVIYIDHDKCVGCGTCVKDCPLHVIELKDGKAVMNAEKCMECGHCEAICPMAAVSLRGYDMNEVKNYDEKTFSIDPDHFLNAVKFRRTIRLYKPVDVEKEKIEKIIEAGRYTPTGSNKQNVRYIVMQHPEKSIEKDGIAAFQKMIKLASIAGRFVKLPADVTKYHPEEGFFFHHAPAVIFVISEDTVNASLASENMEMMAESMKLGVLFSGLFVRAARMNKTIRTKLHMTKREKLVTAIAVGYPDVRYRRTAVRKPASVEWM